MALYCALAETVGAVSARRGLHGVQAIGSGAWAARAAGGCRVREVKRFTSRRERHIAAQDAAHLLRGHRVGRRCALRRHQLAFALEQVDPAGDNRTRSTTALVFAPFEQTPPDAGSYSNNGTQRDPIGSPFCVNLRHRSLLSITSSAVTSSGTFREVGSAPQAVADNVISLPLLGT